MNGFSAAAVSTTLGFWTNRITQNFAILEPDLPAPSSLGVPVSTASVPTPTISKSTTFPALNRVGLLHLSEACTRHRDQAQVISPVHKGFSESCAAWEWTDFLILLASRDSGQLHGKKCDRSW
jgi:hypothetical protein